ncbi:hypothetical protein [Quatrionicoccus australiensis]|uniref:hypothetical protein n=1 Tax=Quatrionicoccus australiensis TaxID=138118 RepID=UPI001CF9ABE6|nr:hypothetical protein [Quatrionicoccus australiensis]MCB4359586.1 hypothetical protein [Quatrionicoccus australiensis]
MDAAQIHPLVLAGKMAMAAELAKSSDDWDKVFSGLAAEYRAQQEKREFQCDEVEWVTHLAVTKDGNVVCDKASSEAVTLTRTEQSPLGSYSTLLKMVEELRQQNTDLLRAPANIGDKLFRAMFWRGRYQVLYRHVCSLYFMLLGTNSVRVDFGSKLEGFMRQGRREECLVRLAVLSSIVQREEQAYGEMQSRKEKR